MSTPVQVAYAEQLYAEKLADAMAIVLPNGSRYSESTDPMTGVPYANMSLKGRSKRVSMFLRTNHPDLWQAKYEKQRDNPAFVQQAPALRAPTPPRRGRGGFGRGRGRSAPNYGASTSSGPVASDCYVRQPPPERAVANRSQLVWKRMPQQDSAELFPSTNTSEFRGISFSRFTNRTVIFDRLIVDFYIVDAPETQPAGRVALLESSDTAQLAETTFTIGRLIGSESSCYELYGGKTLVEIQNPHGQTLDQFFATRRLAVQRKDSTGGASFWMTYWLSKVEELLTPPTANTSRIFRPSIR